jgi:hypothetical protein
MEHTRQTRHLQTQNVPQVRVDTAEKLVYENSHAMTSFSKNVKIPAEVKKRLEEYLPPFDLVAKLRMISQASPKRQRTSSFRKKFIAAMRERVASGAASSEEAAATWLLGKALLYYEHVLQTWGQERSTTLQDAGAVLGGKGVHREAQTLEASGKTRQRIQLWTRGARASSSSDSRSTK